MLRVLWVRRRLANEKEGPAEIVDEVVGDGNDGVGGRDGNDDGDDDIDHDDEHRREL